MLSLRFLCFGFLFSAAILITGHRAALASAGSTPILYTVAPRYNALAWLKGEDRFPKGAQLWLARDGQNRILVKGFAATADASASFDATHVLFAGKKLTNQPWQIWELSLADTKLTQVTACASDCIRPLYLPDDRLVYARKVNSRFVLEAASLNGKDQLQLSYAPGNFLPNDVLQDGRILFASAFPLDSGNAPELYTVYSDGSGVESYRCDHVLPRFGGKQFSSGDVVFTHGAELARFTSPLATEAPLSLHTQQNGGEVAELADSDWLLSQRSHPNGRYEIVRLNVDSASSRTLLSDVANDLVQPVLLRPRPIPNRHPSGLHDWQVANLLSLDVRTSCTPLPDRKAASVRGYTLDGTGHRMLLGNSSIADDGSFFVQVAGDQPVQFEIVDGSGSIVAREHGWFWSRKGEQRVCVGCHAGPEHAPENAIPQILLQSTEPTKMVRASATSRGGKK